MQIHSTNNTLKIASLKYYFLLQANQVLCPFIEHYSTHYNAW